MGAERRVLSALVSHPSSLSPTHALRHPCPDPRHSSLSTSLRVCQNLGLSYSARGNPHEQWGPASYIAPFPWKVGAEGGQLWTHRGVNHIDHDRMNRVLILPAPAHLRDGGPGVGKRPRTTP